MQQLKNSVFIFLYTFAKYNPTNLFLFGFWDIKFHQSVNLQSTCVSSFTIESAFHCTFELFEIWVV